MNESKFDNLNAENNFKDNEISSDDLKDETTNENIELLVRNKNQFSTIFNHVVMKIFDLNLLLALNYAINGMIFPLVLNKRSILYVFK